MRIKSIIIFVFCVGLSSIASIAIGESLLNSVVTDNEGIRDLIKSLDVFAGSKSDKALIDKSRKIQNWAVKQGTGKTLDELRKEAIYGIEATALNVITLRKKHELNVTNIRPDSQSQIRQAITNLMKREGYAVKVETLFTGPFSSVGSIEAIAELEFENEPFSNSRQVWAFRYINNKWLDPGRLSEGWAQAIPMDADGDGVNEILLFTSSMHQGYATISNTLIKLVFQTKYMVMYESMSQDNTGTLNEGAKMNVEILSFDDIDGDGRKELLATNVIGCGRYDRAKKCPDKDKIEVYDLESDKHIKVCGADNYKIAYSETVTTIYKLKGIIYNRWRQTAATVGGSE